MEQKFALIIGGSGGIGIETAKTLLRQGIKVGITYNTNEKRLKKELEEKRIDSKEYSLHKIDLTSEDMVKEAVAAILQQEGKIDMVIHCATAPVTNKTIFELDWKEFQEHWEIQIKGLFTIVKSLSPLIQKNHKIKFITVLTEYCIGKPPALLSHYVAAKYAMMGFMKSMVSELTAHNCTFNMVSPGMVDTPLLDNLHPKIREVNAFKNPMKRIAAPADVAETISFLASEKADYLNGANIVVNGGNVLF